MSVTLPKMTDSTANVSSLADRPVMTAAALKAVFDRAGGDIKVFLNDVLIPALEEAIEEGGSGPGGNGTWIFISRAAPDASNEFSFDDIDGEAREMDLIVWDSKAYRVDTVDELGETYETHDTGGVLPIGRDGVDGQDGQNGQNGTDGEDGGFYVPSVDGSGVLSWTASKQGMPAVTPANIKGEPGRDGVDGQDGQDGQDGTDGEDGGYYVPTIAGGVLSFTATKQGMPAVTPAYIKGDQGAPGEPGRGLTILGFYATLSDLEDATSGLAPGVGDIYGVGAAAPYTLYCYSSGVWTNIGQLQGKSVELQVTSTHIQWRQEGGSWANLVALADITGAPGTPGPNQVTATTTTTLTGVLTGDGSVVGSITKGGANGLADLDANGRLKQDQAITTLVTVSATRNLADGDRERRLDCTNSSGIVLTIPADSTNTTFPIGTQIIVTRSGAGSVTISGATGVYVNGVSGGQVQISATDESLVLWKRTSQRWTVK